MVSNLLATALVTLKVTYGMHFQILLLISSIHKTSNIKLFLQGAVTKILTTRKGLIGFVNVKTRIYEPLFASESEPITMTYDIQRNVIYWADKDGNIYKALNRNSTILYSGHLSATFMQNCLCWPTHKPYAFLFLHLLGQSGLHSLAIDWLTGQLYWTSATQKALYTGAADGSAVGTVMSKEMDPRDMVLSPIERYKLLLFCAITVKSTVISVLFPL